jgi:hypothetical protein
MSSPTVTVAVPVRNYGSLLAQAVRSALTQTRRDLEVLVVDNASTDHTPEVARDLREADERVRYVRNSEDLGYVGSVNRAIAEARGEYLALLAADDLYTRPDFLELALAGLAERPGAAVWCAAHAEVDLEGRPLRDVLPDREALDLSGRDQIRRFFGLRTIWPGTTLVPTILARESGGMDPAYSRAGDLGFFLELCLRGDVRYEPVVVAARRMHPASLCGSSTLADVRGRHLQAIDEFARRHLVGEAGAELTEDWRRGRELILSLLDRERKRDRPAPEAAIALTNALVSGWRASGARVALWGAGEHTERLLALTDLDPSDLAAIADGDRHRHGTTLAGHQVVGLGELLADPPDEVLISSYAYQEQIRADLAPLAERGVQLVCLYDGAAARVPAMEASRS